MGNVGLRTLQHDVNLFSMAVSSDPACWENLATFTRAVVEDPRKRLRWKRYADEGGIAVRLVSGQTGYGRNGCLRREIELFIGVLVDDGVTFYQPKVTVGDDTWYYTQDTSVWVYADPAIDYKAMSRWSRALTLDQAKKVCLEFLLFLQWESLELVDTIANVLGRVPKPRLKKHVSGVPKLSQICDVHVDVERASNERRATKGRTSSGVSRGDRSATRYTMVA